MIVDSLTASVPEPTSTKNMANREGLRPEIKQGLSPAPHNLVAPVAIRSLALFLRLRLLGR